MFIFSDTAKRCLYPCYHKMLQTEIPVTGNLEKRTRTMKETTQRAQVPCVRSHCWVKGLPRLTRGNSHPFPTQQQSSPPLDESTFLFSKEGYSLFLCATSETAKQGSKVAGAVAIYTKLLSLLRACAL